jgi:hypothetical protein
MTLSALIADLNDRGLLDSTIVYCAGRVRPYPEDQQKRRPRPWARSMAVVLAGGGFKRGYAHGTTDANGMAPATEPCTPDDVSATIFSQLGVDPHTELMTPAQRPMPLFREGKVIPKLVG